MTATSTTITRPSLHHVTMKTSRVLASILLLSGMVISVWNARAAESMVQRGKYLVAFGGCNDRHTPGYFFGKPDMNRYLGGSDVGFAIPETRCFRRPFFDAGQKNRTR
jgi:hypothetical protein